MNQFNKIMSVFKTMDMERRFFFAALMVVVVFIFIPAFPPMVDLPQHAAQAASLKEIVLGTFLWGDITELNFFIPYWGGIGFLFLLHLLFPIQIATKILLAISFLSFVLSLSFIRNKLGAEEKLDWLMIPAFFGFAYEWGFWPFIVTASLAGAWFYYINIKFSEHLNARYAFYVFLSGFCLLMMHMLSFCFFTLASIIHIILVRKKFSLKEALYALSPYFLLSIIFAILFFMPVPTREAIGQSRDAISWIPILSRISSFPIYLLPKGYPYVTQCILTISLLFIPFLLGCRFSKRLPSYSMLIAFIIIWLTFPSYAVRTAFIFERFYLFFIPAYIMCFEKKPEYRQFINIRLAQIILYLTVLGMMSIPLLNLWNFRKEAGEFKELLETLPEGKRALTLVYSRHSRTVKTPYLFIHFPLWYQAMKGGWTDFNFAWSSMQIRYRVDALPEHPPNVGDWRPDVVLSTLSHCELYDLIFIKINAEDIGGVEVSLSGTPCASHQLYQKRGDWYVFAK